jgi:hypothetical protein
MLHIEAAAIAEQQNFDCRVNSNYERERDVSGLQNSIFTRCVCSTYKLGNVRSGCSKVLNLCSWGQLGGICPCIASHWIGQVIRQILKWAFASDNGLHEEAEGGGWSQVLEPVWSISATRNNHNIQMLSGEVAWSTRPKFAQELQETRRVSQDAPAMKVIIYFKHVSNDQHIFKNLLYVDGQKPHVYFEYFGSVKIMVD